MTEDEPSKRKRARPRTMHFKSSVLVEALQEIASLKEPGFNWDGSHYQQKRGYAPDLDCLRRHKLVLAEVLRIASSGFPAHKNLMAAMITLQENHSIFNCADKKLHDTASRAADRWRIMCSAVYSLKVNEVAEDKYAGIKDLVDLITLQENGLASAR